MKKTKLKINRETVRELKTLDLSKALGGEDISGPRFTCGPCETYDYPMTCADWTRLRDCTQWP